MLSSLTVVISGVTRRKAARNRTFGQPTNRCCQLWTRGTLPSSARLTNTTSLEVAYIGNKGTNGFAGDGQYLQRQSGPPLFGYQTIASTAATSILQRLSPPLAFLIPSTRPVPCMRWYRWIKATTRATTPAASTTRCEMKLDRRFSQGLQFLTHYTMLTRTSTTATTTLTVTRSLMGPDDPVRNHVWVTTRCTLAVRQRQDFARKSGRAEDYRRGMANYWHHQLERRVAVDTQFNECGPEQDVGVCRPNKGSGSFPWARDRSAPIAIHT